MNCQILLSGKNYKKNVINLLSAELAQRVAKVKMALLMSTHNVCFCEKYEKNSFLGLDVQIIISLTSSLRVISLTVLADSIHNILIFFADKMWVAFALQKLLTFFQQKISAYLRITRCKF